jgi:ribosomal protein S18 acetylase RimI-like enzyme
MHTKQLYVEGMQNQAFRAALPGDAYALAELAITAGDGMYEFLLQEMAPKEMLAGLMARSIKQGNGGLSWRNCFVAVDQGVVIGMINAFPAEWLHEEEQDILPQDRVQVLGPIDQAQDWESFLVNGVAVQASHRRQGIGNRLIEWSVEQARVRRFSRMTSTVWEDNVAARSLFERQKFRVQTRIEVDRHPELSHTGGSLLMVRDDLTFG